MHLDCFGARSIKGAITCSKVMRHVILEWEESRELKAEVVVGEGEIPRVFNNFC